MSPLGTVVAHAGGTGWDELLVVAVPIVVLAVLQVAGRRRTRRSEAAAPRAGDDASVN